MSSRDREVLSWVLTWIIRFLMWRSGLEAKFGPDTLTSRGDNLLDELYKWGAE